jgi:hypothetical protein
MALSEQRWKRNAESAFPWEREALEYVRTSLPDTDPYYRWTNFEFIADDGTVNEVDALVLTPRGASSSSKSRATAASSLAIAAPGPLINRTPGKRPSTTRSSAPIASAKS